MIEDVKKEITRILTKQYDLTMEKAEQFSDEVADLLDSSIDGAVEAIHKTYVELIDRYENVINQVLQNYHSLVDSTRKFLDDPDNVED